MKILTKSDKPEVTNVSQFGIWVVASGSEFFISYSDYPVFEGALLLSVVFLFSVFRIHPCKAFIEPVVDCLFMRSNRCVTTCQLKGINYKTICNKTYLQPNRGKGVKIGGRKCFRKDVVLNWLLQTDSMLV